MGVRKDVEDRLRGMDEAFLVTKANHSKAMERVQEEVEAQSKGKAEAMRARQMQEQELLECREQEADMIAHQTQVVNTVGQLHSEVSSLKAEVEEVKMELAEAEARAESNMLRAAKMVDELRAEQGNSSKAETEKKEVEVRKLVKLFLTGLLRQR